MDKQSFIDTATQYTSRGWNPVCIYKPDKYPKDYNWRALIDKEVTRGDIIEMSNAYTEKDLNIGIITGKISDIIILDIDGEEGFAALKEHGITLPDTLQATTGRGRHYYFEYTSHPVLRNAAGYLPKVDIRTDGGLVVSPPSIHPSGNSYEWVNPDAEILPFPNELIELFVLNAASKSKRTEDRGLPLEERAIEGSRNYTLFKAASAMQGLGFSEELIRETIIKQNDLLASPLTEKELNDTVFASVFKYGISAEIRGLSDYDNALRMRDLYGKDLIYVPEEKEWLRYNGKHWENDVECNNLREKFIAMANTIPREVPQPSEDDKESMEAFKRRVNYALSCRDNVRFNGALPSMCSLMHKSLLDFDSHNNLLCLRNGVLDLKANTLLPHNPNYFMRVMSDVDYLPGATSTLWDSYLNDVFGDDDELRRYVQKAAGYTLSGDNNEKAFFIIKGDSNSGKSVFLNVIGHVLGGFYKKANIETFLYKSGSTGSARPDLASMVNKRVVVASETNDGDRFDEKLIKDITGGEPLTCRDLYKSEITYKPTFKIWLSTNTLPAVRDDSNGVWNRVKVIPFNNVIPDDKIDIHLTDKLKNDASAILNWCIEGYQMYLREGLTEPNSLKEQIEVYREENDVFGAFINDCFILDDSARIERGALFDIFNDWCDKTKTYQKGMSNRKFFKKMRDRGFQEVMSTGVRYMRGLAIKTPSSSVTERIGNTTFVEF